MTHRFVVYGHSDSGCSCGRVWPCPTLDAAWAEAEAALPKGWHFELESGAFDASGLYRASAHWVDFYGDGPPLGQTSDWAATPVVALRALAAKLRLVDGRPA